LKTGIFMLVLASSAYWLLLEEPISSPKPELIEVVARSTA